MFSSCLQEGHEGVEWPRQLILGAGSPLDSRRQEQGLLEKQAKHGAAPLATAWKQQLSVQRQENQGERGKWIPALSPPSPKSLLRGT